MTTSDITGEGVTGDGAGAERVTDDGATGERVTGDGATGERVTGDDAADGSPVAEPSGGVPPEVAARLVRALDRAPSMFVTLIDANMHSAWLSTSATWITGTDPVSRPGRHALERIHPDDVPRLIHGMEQLRAVPPRGGTGVPVVEPLRYRIRRPDDTWITVEAFAQNLLEDPEVQGLLVMGRRVGGELDGVGHVVDLLVSDAALPCVLAACADLVPHYLGAAAVVGLVDGDVVVGTPAGSPVGRLAADERWWRDAVGDCKTRTTAGFAGFPDDLAAEAYDAGFRSVWVVPLTDATSGDALGAVVAWVRLDVELNIATEDGLRQAARLATLVIGEQRRHEALRREAMTDPLTGLGNRSALRRRLDADHSPVTVALVDLDGFKPVNDTHGHEVGDEVLRVVGRRLLAAVREDDCVVRFGGDEFAVVFADGTTPDGVSRATERIAAAIGTPLEAAGGLTLAVTASIGVATAPPTEVVPLADRALYQAKARRDTPR
ncbi:MAG TPA: GGDEF domain-containing protein [Acidimicrobiales bacterium]|nr:GGDEF domain-containing protein [Acidimicrobiales bacterium]